MAGCHEGVGGDVDVLELDDGMEEDDDAEADWVAWAKAAGLVWIQRRRPAAARARAGVRARIVPGMSMTKDGEGIQANR